jgi:hypothetical protein
LKSSSQNPRFIIQISHFNFTMRHLILFLLLIFPLQAKPPERPKPDLLYLENDSMKIGIDRSMGASITWLSWKNHQENIVNIHDPGRLIQQSYYAGNNLDRTADGQHKAWSPWTWNPIQGGGVNSWSNVTRFEKLQDKALISITIPKLWDMPNEEAEATMTQKTEFEPGMPNVVRINNRLVCQRTENDKWGPAVRRHQELPALYFTSQFRNIESYLGKGKWQRVEQPPGPPWGKTTPPLKVMACFNDKGQGIAVFSPSADAHWNFGPHSPYTPSAKATDSPCIHLAPIGKVMLGSKSTLEYRYWMITGSKEEITKRADALLAKYSKEALSVTNKK